MDSIWEEEQLCDPSSVCVCVFYSFSFCLDYCEKALVPMHISSVRK